jgi:hypothetical protein
LVRYGAGRGHRRAVRVASIGIPRIPTCDLWRPESLIVVRLRARRRRRGLPPIGLISLRRGRTAGAHSKAPYGWLAHGLLRFERRALPSPRALAPAGAKWTLGRRWRLLRLLRLHSGRPSALPVRPLAHPSRQIIFTDEIASREARRLPRLRRLPYRATRPALRLPKATRRRRWRLPPPLIGDWSAASRAHNCLWWDRTPAALALDHWRPSLHPCGRRMTGARQRPAIRKVSVHRLSQTKATADGRNLRRR